MGESAASLKRKIKTAGELQSVVRTMKALASSSIGQYEKSVHSLADYYRTVELGLGAALRKNSLDNPDFSFFNKHPNQSDQMPIGAIVFGSDQGLVGRFNEEIVDYAKNEFSKHKGIPKVWAVGDRVHARLIDSGIKPVGIFSVPNTIVAINTLVGQIQIRSEEQRSKGSYSRLIVFYNRLKSKSVFEPTKQLLLPLDESWQEKRSKVLWPTKALPEVMRQRDSTLLALIREYLYISLYKACAQSLASENASRLAAMERADKNIDELLRSLHVTSQRLRQESIDEELFEVIAGFQALKDANTQKESK